MDKREAIMTAQRYVDAVCKKYPLTRALIFGSYARDVAHVDSDIDVAIVLKSTENLFDTQVALMHLRSDDDLLIEPHVFRENDFTTDNPLVCEILQVGMELAIRD
jgi:predicted nucleotidyltransferase